MEGQELGMRRDKTLMYAGTRLEGAEGREVRDAKVRRNDTLNCGGTKLRYVLQGGGDETNETG